MQGRHRGPHGPEWSKSTVARVLRNPAYLGHARQGETVNVEAHEPIVTQAEFDAANQKRQPVERRAVTEIEGVPVKASMADRALLRGIAVCANCGHNLRAGNGWLDRKTGERLPFYYCPGRFTSGKCEHRANLSAPPARSYVGQLVLSAFEGDSPVAEAVQAQRELQDLARQREEAQHLLTGSTAPPLPRRMFQSRPASRPRRTDRNASSAARHACGVSVGLMRAVVGIAAIRL